MRSLIIVMLMFLIRDMSGQDLSRLKSGEAFRIKRSATLSLSYNGVGSSSDSYVDQADAFSINMRGNFEFLGIAFPVQLTFRKGQFNSAATNPFVRLGISPTYKWIKLYAGHRNMHFSRYSLSDITFLGAGVELNPGIFRMAAMYGEIKTPNYNLDTLAFQTDLISNYKRLAYGLKLGLGKERNHVDLFYFKGRDHYKLIDAEEIYVTKLPPPENLVIGTDARFIFLKKLTASFNINMSILTNNQLAREDTLQDDLSESIRKVVGSFITANNTTRANLAGEAGLQWQDKYFNIGVQYKRIDPNYRSFGIHYILDDLENYTVNGGLRLFKNRLNFNGNLGLQRNNLKHIRRNTSERLIYNISSNLILKSNGGLNLTYSNFAIDQRAGLVMLNDTFRFVQNTSVISVSPFYHWGNEKTKQNLQFSYNTSQVRDLSPTSEGQSNGQTQTQVLNYRVNFKEKEWSLGIGLQRNRNVYRDIESERLGGNIHLGKTLNKPEMQMTLQTGYSILSQNGAKDGFAINSVLNTSWKINKRASLSFLVAYLKKSSIQSRKYDEIRFSTNLSYNLLDSNGNGKKK